MSSSPDSGCPEPAQLRRFLESEPADVERDTIGRHIEKCLDCQGKLERMTNVALQEMPLLPIWAQAPFPTAEQKGTPFPPPSEWPALPGYEILGVLGAGGMGLVFLALQARPKRRVALKVIRADADQRARARFRNEAEAMARLQHPNIIPIYEVGEHLCRPFFAMEYLVGGSLSELLGDVPQEPNAAARLVEGLARAMHYAHQRGVIHRDLKPGNILVAGPAEPPGPMNGVATCPLVPDPVNIKITDFGLAKLRSTEDIQTCLTLPDQPLGTPSYMSTEQASGKVEEIGTLSDVYALGAILYKMLTGHPPFEGRSDQEIIDKVRSPDHFPLRPSQRRPGVPRDLESICLKCLEKEPARRYSSAEQLAEELRRFRQHEPLLHTRPVGRLERLRRWCRRKPALATAAGLAAVLLVAAIAGPVGFAIQEYNHSRELASALRDVKVQLARNRLEQGLTLCNQGDTGLGLLRLAQSLSTAPNDADDLRRMIRMNLAAWSSELSALTACLEHPGKVLAVAFSPNGRIVATGCADGKARLWDCRTEQLLCAPLEHRGEVLAVAFSRDGETVLTGSADGTARLWHGATGNRAGVSIEPGGAVAAVAFSSDGKLILTGSNRAGAQLWDVATGKATALGDPDKVLAVAFNSDGRTALTASKTASKKGLVQLWAVPSGERSGSFQHPTEVFAMAFSPDGQSIITSNWDRTASLWKVNTGPNHFVSVRHPANVSAMAFSPDGRTVVTGSTDHAARLWDVATGTLIGQPLPHPCPVLAVAFSPDSRILVTAGSDGTARLWKAPEKDVVTVLPHGSDVRAVAINSDGRRAVTGSFDGTARVWDVATGQAVCPPLLHPRNGRWQLACVAISPKGDKVITGSWDFNARLWSVETGQLLGPILPHGDVVSSVAFSSDGQRVVTGSLDRSAQVWEADGTGRPVGQPLRHQGAVHTVAFSPDSRTVLTGSSDQTARVWSVATGQPVYPPLQHQGAVPCAAFSSDGKMVLTGSDDRTARLWDAVSGAPYGEPLPHQDGVTCVAFSPNGETVLTGSTDNSARVWSVASQKPLGPPLPHQGVVWSVGFSPDSQMVLTGSGDRTARLWDAASGKPLGPPMRHAGDVRCVAFSPCGRRVLTGNDGQKGNGSQTAALWAVPAPIQGDAQRIAVWVQVLTGMHLDAGDGARTLDATTWRQRRQELNNLGPQ